MDPGHSPGEQGRRGATGGAGGHGPSDEDTARRAARPVRPSARQPRSRQDVGELPRDDAAARHLHAPSGQPSSDPAQYDISDFRDRLFSGPVAELYGVGGGDTPGSGTPGGDSAGGFAAFGEDSGTQRDDGSADAAAVPPAPRREGEGPPDQGPETSSGLVRPYFRTRGRTKPSYDLALEALVSTSERGRTLDGVRVPEHRSICDLCLDTRSVAEVAALLNLPLGVVRVLVGDVAGMGLVLVHSASSGVGDRPSIEFMERVLSGLRRI